MVNSKEKVKSDEKLVTWFLKTSETLVQLDDTEKIVIWQPAASLVCPRICHVGPYENEGAGLSVRCCCCFIIIKWMVFTRGAPANSSHIALVFL